MSDIERTVIVFMKSAKVLRILAIVLTAVICCMSFSACREAVNIDETGAADVQNYPVTVNEVTISSKPSRVVVLGEGLADCVLALGCETQLAAVTEDCTQEEFTSLTKIASGDIEAVIAASPDLVIANSLNDENKQKLSDASITYVEIAAATNRQDYERLYTQLGSIFGGASSGYSSGLIVAQNIFTSLDDLSRIIPETENNKIVTACYLYDSDSTCITGENFISVLMDYAGLTNAFKGASDGTYTIESLQIADPDIIFCPTGLKSILLEDENFKDLSAIKNGNVYEIERSAMVRQGRTVITTATTMAGCAYPSLLSDTTAQVQPEVNREEVEAEEKAAEDEAARAAALDNSAEADEEDALFLGETSDEVYAMQARLFELGYLTVEFDGYF